MELAKGEEIIQEWDYAQARNIRENVHSKLVVTNKRIINTQTSHLGKGREEIYIKDIDGVQCSAKRKSNLPAYIIIGMSAICFMLFIVSLLQDQPVAVFATTAVMGLVLLAIGGVLLSVASNFSIIIKTAKPLSTLLGIGLVRKGIFSKNNAYAMRIKIKTDVAMEIVDKLGTIILNLKEEQEK